MILGKIISQESLAISDEELENGYQEMADSFNQPVGFKRCSKQVA